MPTRLDVAAPIDTGSQYNCVATQQKAVYNWYEMRHSDDDVVDIYSLEWQERITGWHAWFIKTHGGSHVHSETPKLREAPEDLDLRIFFFEHPIATFSLWHVMQAFYDFDKAVFGTSREAETTLSEWQKLKPFEYLAFDDIMRRWKAELKKMDTEISYGDLSGEKLKSRMYDILDAVERLETALLSLEVDFKFDYNEKKSAEWMLDTITDAFDRRCLMIATFLKRDANEPAFEVIVSDPRGEGILTTQPPLPGEPNAYLYPFLFVLVKLLSVYMYDIAYVVFSIAVVILSLYAYSGLRDFGFLSRNYD